MNGETQQIYTKASVLDKTDWRKVIQARLEYCVNTIGNIDFPKSVKSLVSAVSARFPGFDAETLIDKWIQLTQLSYELKKAIWLTNNQTEHIWNKKIHYAELKIQRDEEVFIFIKNLLAERRILLYGIKQRQQSSEEMLDEEE
jgi:hypothetical protein